MAGNQSLYSVLGSLYDAHMLAQLPLPSDRMGQAGSNPFGREPLQIISSGSARAPMPQQQQSGAGGGIGAGAAIGSMFAKGGPFGNVFFGEGQNSVTNNYDLMKSMGTATGSQSEQDLFSTLSGLQNSATQGSSGMGGSWFSNMFSGWGGR